MPVSTIEKHTDKTVIVNIYKLKYIQLQIEKHTDTTVIASNYKRKRYKYFNKNFNIH